jgi:hypothetical protein
MRTIKHIAIGALGSFCLIGPAITAEMTGGEIKDLIAGKTIYVELTAVSATGTKGQGVLYFATDSTALFKIPKGDMWHGTWTVKDNAVCIDWKEAPNTPCRKYDKQGDTISVVNSATGEVIAKILKNAPGNAEKLAP